MYIFGYAITILFVLLFYKRYKAISTTDSAYQLMKNILKTRKIVKYYIFYVLASSGIVAFVTFIFTLLYSSDFENVRDEINWPKAIGFGLLLIIVFIIILWLIYSLVYGILLKKLYRNYKELKRLEL